MNPTKPPPARLWLTLPATIPLAVLIISVAIHDQWPAIPDVVQALVRFGAISNLHYLILAGSVLTYVIFSILWFRYWRRREKLHERWLRKICIHCAYDLRAHLPGDKCPECGTIIPTRIAS